MNIEEPLRMYAPDWRSASEVHEGETIAVWGNWKVVTRVAGINEGRRLEFFYRAPDGSEKSVKCYPDDIVAMKAG